MKDIEKYKEIVTAYEKLRTYAAVGRQFSISPLTVKKILLEPLILYDGEIPIEPNIKVETNYAELLPILYNQVIKSYGKI